MKKDFLDLLTISDGENQKIAFLAFEKKHGLGNIIHFLSKTRPAYAFKLHEKTIFYILENKNYIPLFDFFYTNPGNKDLIKDLGHFVNQKIKRSYTIYVQNENHRAMIKWNKVLLSHREKDQTRFSEAYESLQSTLRNVYIRKSIARKGLMLDFYKAIDNKYSEIYAGENGYIEEMYEANKKYYSKGVFIVDKEQRNCTEENFNEFFEYIILQSDRLFFKNYKQDLSFLYRVYNMTNYETKLVSDFKNKYPEYLDISQKDQKNYVLLDAIKKLKSGQSSPGFEDFSILEDFSIENIMSDKNNKIMRAIFDVDFETNDINPKMYNFLEKITVESEKNAFCDVETLNFLKILLIITKMIMNNKNNMDLSLNLPFPEVTNLEFINLYPAYTTKLVLDESIIKEKYAIISSVREQKRYQEILFESMDVDLNNINKKRL